MNYSPLSYLSQLSNDQVRDIISYVDTNDFKSLRLSGNKAMCLSDPKLTCHLQLRMDKVPFFLENNLNFSEDYIKLWLTNRSRIVIQDVNVPWSLHRVSYLISNGFMNSVNEIVVHNCHCHHRIIELLSHLPHVTSITLVDRGDHSSAADGLLETIIAHVGDNMTSLTSLDIEFDTVIHGSRLKFLRRLEHLTYLRLIGFDLSEGICNVGLLHQLTTLHLCHGNFYSSPNDDVNEKDLTDLIGLRKLKRLHLEGFDCLTGAGLASFATQSIQDLILKHCQETSIDCLSSIERMENLNSLHIVNGSCDDFDTFDTQSLQRLNSLSELKSLSLFYVLDDYSDLRALPGLTSLKTLNVALDENLNREDVENICRMFPMVQKLRVFSENGMEHTYQHDGVDIEFASFSFGDILQLD